MRPLSVALVAAIGTLAFTPIAFAAHATKKALPHSTPPLPAPYTWTGWYAGVNGGGGWSTVSNTMGIADGPLGYFTPPAIPGLNASGSGSLNGAGVFTGGVQAGYNQQIERYVYGIEADFNWLRQAAAFGGLFHYTTNGVAYLMNVSRSTDWLATVRPRIGWLMTDNVLVYGTGGFAMTDVHFNQSFTDPATSEAVSASRVAPGWTIGAGVEDHLAGNWTIKVEYLFAQLYPRTVVGQLNGPGGTSATFNNSLGNLNFNVFRLGLNYKFN